MFFKPLQSAKYEWNVWTIVGKAYLVHIWGRKLTVDDKDKRSNEEMTEGVADDRNTDDDTEESVFVGNLLLIN